ncbi:MAG: tyrosinase family protein, partial [Proteobacteria bacterium]
MVRNGSDHSSRIHSMSNMGRRKFLAMTSGTLATGLLYGACKTANESASLSAVTPPTDSIPKTETKPSPRVRQRWIPGVDAEIKNKYVQAVTWLKANDGKTFPEDDPRSYLSWERFVAIHNISCHHGDWYIFPWHRNFVNYFELACQVALDDPSFALPYWDWTLDGKIPDEFYDLPILAVDRDLIKGTALPEEFVGPKMMDKILADENFFSFFSKPVAKTRFERLVPRTGAFEAGPHNKVHNTIGNFMSGNTSPTDPIFWLHHSNVDRIYCQWAINHPGSNMPYPIVDGTDTNPTTGHNNEEWFDEEMVLNSTRDVTNEKGETETQDVTQASLSYKTRSLAANVKVSDLQSMDALGYTYDTIPKPSPKGQSHVAVIKQTRLLTRVSGKIARSNRKITSSITLTKSLTTTVLDEFKKSKLNYASLLVENIVPPKDIVGLSLRFFIATGRPSDKTLDLWAEKSFNDESYIGSLTFLNSHHHHREEPLNGSAEFDISVWLRNQINEESLKSFTLIAVAVNTKGT